MRKINVGFAYLCALGVAACGSSQVVSQNTPVMAAKVPAKTALLEGERAMALGDPVLAIGLLESIASTESSYAYAQQLLAAARREARALVAYWLSDIDQMVHERRYATARDRCEYMLYVFPLDDDDRAQVQRRLRKVRLAWEEAASQLQELDDVAARALLHNDLERALDALHEAQKTGWEIEPAEALQRQRVVAIALTRRRLEEAAKGKTLQTADASPAIPASRDTCRPLPLPSRTSVFDKASEPNKTRQEPMLKDLLHSAARYREEGEHFRAVVDYLRILELDPKNTEAKLALTALQSHRQALIRQYLDDAQRLFLRQDLLGAVPFYRRVLLLDETNEQARNGLQMYNNLERIRREGATAGRSLQ